MATFYADQLGAAMTPVPECPPVGEMVAKYSDLLAAHRISEQHQEKLVLFVEECLPDDDPFIEEVDRNEQLQRFVEDVLMQENEVLGEALKELLSNGQESL